MTTTDSTKASEIARIIMRHYTGPYSTSFEAFEHAAIEIEDLRTRTTPQTQGGLGEDVRGYVMRCPHCKEFHAQLSCALAKNTPSSVMGEVCYCLECRGSKPHLAKNTPPSDHSMLPEFKEYAKNTPPLGGSHKVGAEPAKVGAEPTPDVVAKDVVEKVAEAMYIAESPNYAKANALHLRSVRVQSLYRKQAQAAIAAYEEARQPEDVHALANELAECNQNLGKERDTMLADLMKAKEVIDDFINGVGNDAITSDHDETFANLLQKAHLALSALAKYTSVGGE